MANPWDILGVLWRVLLFAVPIVAIAWALTRGRRVDSSELARSRREIEARNVPPPPTSTYTGS